MWGAQTSHSVFVLKGDCVGGLIRNPPGRLLVQIFSARPLEDSGKEPEYARRMKHPICPENASVNGAKWSEEKIYRWVDGSLAVLSMRSTNYVTFCERAAQCQSPTVNGSCRRRLQQTSLCQTTWYETWTWTSWCLFLLNFCAAFQSIAFLSDCTFVMWKWPHFRWACSQSERGINHCLSPGEVMTPWIIHRVAIRNNTSMTTDTVCEFFSDNGA